MREHILSRVKVAAWVIAFLAPVAVMEIGREVRAWWSMDRSYSTPTPEFFKAMEASRLASADR